DELGTLIACANIEGSVAPATPEPNATPAETPGPTPTGAGGITETPTPTQSPATETVAPTEPSAQTPTETATATSTEAPTEVTTPTATTPPEDIGDEGAQDGTGGADAAPESVASLPLADYSGLGVTGTVSLIALDEETTKVTITLEGDIVTGGHIAHLHPGTCDALQDAGTIYLATVATDGVSETTVGRSLSSLINDGWSVNVHLSEDAWDTWLVCGYLGDATGGMTGVADITPIAGGTTTTPTPASVVTTADGTSGVSTKGDPVTTTTLTQSVGVGSTLLWPDSPVQAVIWSLAIFALVLATAGLVLRRGARNNGQPTRWHRLGL
ncbi:MAG TPA: hypothetical protein VD789_05140, partial [Thermomicrobiales bacterium]|nr:hypothetical protein [Thermomicrobiales bacterium]